MTIYVLLGKTLSGKSTLIKKLKTSNLNVDFPVSFTSRPKRINEVDGEDYYFISRDATLLYILTERSIANREYYPDISQGLLSWYYGILKTEIASGHNNKKMIVTDALGLEEINKNFDDVKSIYLDISHEEQEKRFKSRDMGLSNEQIRRIKDDDIQFKNKKFDYVIDASKKENDIYKEVLSIIGE